jgi:hypothetical protein
VRTALPVCQTVDSGPTGATMTTCRAFGRVFCGPCHSWPRLSRTLDVFFVYRLRRLNRDGGRAIGRAEYGERDRDLIAVRARGNPDDDLVLTRGAGGKAAEENVGLDAPDGHDGVVGVVYSGLPLRGGLVDCICIPPWRLAS